MKRLCVVAVSALMMGARCPLPIPGPTPTPPPEPPPVVVVPPQPACEIAPGSEWELQPRTDSPYVSHVNAALKAEVGDACDIGNRCVLPEGGEQDFINRVILRLREAGLCAGRQVENGDKVAVGIGQGDNWTFHVVAFGSPGSRPTVAWQPSAAEPPDHWIAKAVTPPEPPKPPPSAECPPLSFITVHARPQADWIIDATPKTGPREVCDKLGFVDRGECPFGPEIEGGANPERVRCETAAGPYTWTVNGEPCVGCENNGNPLQIRVPRVTTGRVTVCGANGACGSAVLQ